MTQDSHDDGSRDRLFGELVGLAIALVCAGLALGNLLDNPTDHDKMPAVITMFILAAVFLGCVLGSLFVRIRRRR